MRVLVTGGLGNLGSATLQALTRAGHDTRSLDLLTPRTRRLARRLDHQHRQSMAGKTPRPAIDWRWGDVRDPAMAQRAVAEMDVVVHLASILPPPAHDQPALAESVNVGGTRALLDAAMRQPTPPRFLFASSFNVFGPTTHLAPPRTVRDPLIPTDNYSRHKILCEAEAQRAGMPWAIFRFADMPLLGARPMHPLMFEIPLDTRLEIVHPHDAALAIANGVSEGAIWGQVWLIGGGPTCQLTYGDYLTRMLGALGLSALPETAFGRTPYCTDWLDTTASQAALRYQRHTSAEIMADVARGIGPARYLTPLARPFITRRMLRLSPYYRH
jgi:nucleoside-diphosphate-sugar epimerase